LYKVQVSEFSVRHPGCTLHDPTDPNAAVTSQMSLLLLVIAAVGARFFV